MSPKKGTPTPATKTAATGKTSRGFTDVERAAIQERTRELKAAARRGPRGDKADGERDVLGKIAELPEPRLALRPGGARPPR